MIITDINIENTKSINNDSARSFEQSNYAADEKYPFKWTLIGTFIFCAAFWALVFYFFMGTK